jgi:KDZ transposase-like protein
MAMTFNYSTLSRYINMDYFLLSSLRGLELSRIVISYDIACQWSRNLKRCCSTYGPNMISDLPDLEITYMVPKFHLPAHITKCQEDFSFNFTPYVGRTDGESPERGWAAANAIANSTKEMGPGSRRDTLDDHFGDYNWRKITDLGKLLLYDDLEDN